MVTPLSGSVTLRVSPDSVEIRCNEVQRHGYVGAQLIVHAVA